jgi:anti-sigma B factor antagonist
MESQEDLVGSSVSSGANGQRSALAVSRFAEGIAVIAVTCELDMLTVPAFEQVLAEQSRAGHRVLVVDLSGCEFMGSSGLAALVEAHDRSQRGGTPLALARLRRALARGIAITGLDTLFDIYPSVEEAAAAFPGG